MSSVRSMRSMRGGFISRNWGPSMRSMRSMRGGFIFRNRGPSLKVHLGQCLTSMSYSAINHELEIKVTVTVTVTGYLF
jgi:hypothetical protein